MILSNYLFWNYIDYALYLAKILVLLHQNSKISNQINQNNNDYKA